MLSNLREVVLCRRFPVGHRSTLLLGHRILLPHVGFQSLETLVETVVVWEESWPWMQLATSPALCNGS